jgi:hypothetical protein
MKYQRNMFLQVLSFLIGNILLLYALALVSFHISFRGNISVYLLILERLLIQFGYHRVCNKSNTTGVVIEAGTV